MSHENSKTVQDSDGSWINVSGHTGKTLRPIHSFEKTKYRTVKEAVSAAKRRSKLFNTTKDKLKIKNKRR